MVAQGVLGLGDGDGRCMAGDGGDGVGEGVGLGSVSVLGPGVGVGLAPPAEGVPVPPGLAATPDAIGLGDDAAGRVDENTLVSGAAGSGLPGLDQLGVGAEVAAPVGDAAGAVRAEDRPWSWVTCSTWMETAESARKAIAPADTTMTGTVLPAGWDRTTAPAWPTVVRTRSVSSATASWPAGSRGQ